MTAMTIVIVNDFGSVNGGASQVAIASACGLKNRGHRIIFFCATAPVDKALMDAGVEVVCLDQHVSLEDPNRLRGAAQNLWNGKAAHALRAVLDGLDSKNTLVHVHVWTKALSASIFPAVRAADLPLVITLHDYFAACPNGALFSYQMNSNCPHTPMSVSCVLHNCEKTGSRAMKNFRLLRQVLQGRAGGLDRGDWHAIGVSDFALSRIQPFLPRGVDCHLLLNPDESTAPPRAAPEQSDIFLAVGRLVPEKGMTLFAAAARQAGVRAVFVGDGEEAKAIAAINPQAELLGWMSHGAALDQMQRARALVFPSLWPETQGLVVDEGAARGIPAIVSDNTAARDRIDHGKTGLHFRSGNLESLVECLIRLKEPTLAAEMGHTAYDRYWSMPHGPDRHIDGLENIYRKVSAQAGTSR